jgi:hypothetical protein
LINIDNPSGIYARWIARLEEYEFDIIYRPGRKNQNADALSRMRQTGPRFKTSFQQFKEEAGHPGTASSSK